MPQTTITPDQTATLTVQMTKELFIETMQAIIAQMRHDRKCAKAFGVILPNDFVTCYDNSRVIEQLIKLLQMAMNDHPPHSFIEYYLYDLQYGKEFTIGCVHANDKPVKLQTSEDLWALLTDEPNFV